MNRITAGVIKVLRPVIVQPSGQHTASVIFLHGSGSSGLDIKQWIDLFVGAEGFSFPHVKLIYPTAPSRPYTPAGGMLSAVWFDRKQISPFVPEEVKNIDNSCDLVEQLVVNEEKSGINRDRIIVGGFSMGGSLALYYGYRKCHSLAGVFALSSFLGESSCVYTHLAECSGPFPPLFQCHGRRDNLVLYDWGMMTHKKMKKASVNTTFHFFPNLCHELGREEVLRLKDWIESTLPEQPHS